MSTERDKSADGFYEDLNTFEFKDCTVRPGPIQHVPATEVEHLRRVNDELRVEINGANERYHELTAHLNARVQERTQRLHRELEVSAQQRARLRREQALMFAAGIVMGACILWGIISAS